MKYVASKSQKAFMTDLKPIYRATSKKAAKVTLDQQEERWGKQYPMKFISPCFWPEDQVSTYVVFIFKSFNRC
jgi:transposase-like protein